jgi:surface carbohydrate biosynthesis protein
MIKNFFLVFKVLLNAKYRFSNPKHKDLIIFDGNTFEELKYVLSGFNYIVLETRIQRVKEFYISKEILFSIIKNYNKNIFNSYLLSIIDQINPKVVFTYIDNSYRFSEFSKIRKKKYDFIALQNGARYEHKIIEKLKKKKIRVPIDKFDIPNFFCFGDYEIEDYKRTNQNVKNFHRVGSLKLANFELKKKIRKNFKEYDILLISDANCWDLILNQLNYPIEKGLIKLIKYTIKFSIKNNLRIKIAARNSKNNFGEERNFYKKNLTNIEYKYLVKNIFFRQKKYKTYDMVLKSKLVIGTMSTILRENLSLGGKTLACNFTKTDIFNFPIKGICFLDKDNYNYFEKRLNNLFKISNKKYLIKLNKKVPYVSYTNLTNKTDTINLIRNKIRSILIK